MSYLSKRILSIVCALAITIAIGPQVLAVDLPNQADFTGSDNIAILVGRQASGEGIDSPTSRVKLYSTTPTMTIRVRDAHHCPGTGGTHNYDYNASGVTVNTYIRIFDTNASEGIANYLTGTGPITSPGTGTGGCSATWDPVYTMTHTGSKSTVEGNTDYYVFVFQASIATTGLAYNGMTLTTSTPGAKLGYSNNAGDKFALKSHWVPSGPTYSDYNLYFGTDCSVAATETKLIRWLDADHGQPNQLLTMSFRLYDETEGAYVPLVDSTGASSTTISGADLGGQNAARSRSVTFKANHKYRWTWRNVSSYNGLQLEFPYDSAFYTANCNPPTLTYADAAASCDEVSGTGFDPDSDTIVDVQFYRGPLGASDTSLRANVSAAVSESDPDWAITVPDSMKSPSEETWVRYVRIRDVDTTGAAVEWLYLNPDGSLTTTIPGVYDTFGPCGWNTDLSWNITPGATGSTIEPGQTLSFEAQFDIESASSSTFVDTLDFQIRLLGDNPTPFDVSTRDPGELNQGYFDVSDTVKSSAYKNGSYRAPELLCVGFDCSVPDSAIGLRRVFTGPFQDGTTHTLSIIYQVAADVDFGDELCFHARVQPTNSLDSNYNVLDPVCYVVTFARETFLESYGNDIHSGAGIVTNRDNAHSCAATIAPGSGVVNSNYTSTASLTPDQRSSKTQFALSALSTINNWGSNNWYFGEPDSNLFTFAQPSLGILGNYDVSANPICRQNYIGITTGSDELIPEIEALFDPATTNIDNAPTTFNQALLDSPGKFDDVNFDHIAVNSSAADTINVGGVGPLTIKKGIQITIVAKGNIYISQNINYEDFGYTDRDNIPALAVITEGNIYIDPNVTELFGHYYAGGVIDTCNESDGGLNLDNNADIGRCKSVLNVSGNFFAKSFEFRRTFGDTRGSGGSDADPAEVINFIPQMYLSTPPLVNELTQLQTSREINIKGERPPLL